MHRTTRVIGPPAFAAAAILVLTTSALLTLAHVNEDLDSAVTSREGVNRVVLSDIGVAERTRALTALRAEDVRAEIARQEAALSSRDGFLP